VCRIVVSSSDLRVPCLSQKFLDRSGGPTPPTPCALLPLPMEAPRGRTPREHGMSVVAPRARKRLDPTRHQRYGAVGAPFCCLFE
jgi:hypothetical protein